MDDVSHPGDRTSSSVSQNVRLGLLWFIRCLGFRDEYFLILVSIAIGAATGVFAHLFYGLIGRCERIAYGGDGSTEGLYGGRWWMLIVLPAGGALLVGFLVRYFAREAKGHGVPEVMDALYRRNGEIRPRVAGIKALASALTIGSGGSAGTEGPIIQIGAAIASTLGRFLRVPRRQMGVITGCGASAGIAAIFNAPLAGVLFALEIFLKDFSFKTFSPLVFSSVISCSVMHAFLGEDSAIFEVQTLRNTDYVFAGSQLLYFLILGLLAALAAVAFIRALYFSEDVADRLRIPDVIKPVVGATLLGATAAGYVWLKRIGHEPPFFGNGYAWIEVALGPELLGETVHALILLFGLKLLATCFTLGSGGSGGVFAPSLFMGAALGGAFGMSLQSLGLINDASVSAYALVGMAAMVAAATHAPLTSIVILYEITREPKVILPVMFAAIVSTIVAQRLFPDSIYTLRLRRRGVRLGSVMDLTILRGITAGDVERQPVPFVRAEDPLQQLIDQASETEVDNFVVVDDHAVYCGMVLGQDLHHVLLQPDAVSLLVVDELARPDIPTVSIHETLDLVLSKFAKYEVEALPIASLGDTKQIEGIITRREVMRKYQEELDRQTG